MGEPERDGSGATTASEAFKAVGNPLRARIIQALGDARGAKDAPPVLAFSELRDLVADSVDSSQFNYHLKQLVGPFIHRTADGYQMRPAGMLLYRTIRAGTITEALPTEAISLGVECYRCGAGLEADPSFGEFWIECPGCDTFYDMVMAPPRGIEAADGAALLSRLDQYNRHKHLAYLRGMCPICMGGVDQELRRAVAQPYDRARTREHHVHWSCRHCGNRRFASLGMALLETPAVVSHFEAAGVDPADRSVWELEWAMTDRTVSVADENPLVFAVDIEVGDEATTLSVDRDLTVRVDSLD